MCIVAGNCDIKYLNKKPVRYLDIKDRSSQYITAEQISRFVEKCLTFDYI